MNAPNDCFTHHLIWQQGVRRNIAVFCVIGANLNFVGFFLCLYHHSTTVMIASNCPLNHTRLSGKGISSQQFFSSLMSVADDTLCT